MKVYYITCKDEAEAERISRALIEKRLVACCNMFPIKSLYRWKGDLAGEEEIVIIAKSSHDNYNEIEKEVKALHSYEIPCILLFDVKANKDFEEWVKGEINEGRREVRA